MLPRRGDAPCYLDTVPRSVCLPTARTALVQLSTATAPVLVARGRIGPLDDPTNAWSKPRMATPRFIGAAAGAGEPQLVRLDAASIEAVASRVVDLMCGQSKFTTPLRGVGELVTAADVARRFALSREWVRTMACAGPGAMA